MTKLWVDGAYIYCRAPYALKDEIKAVPGARWDANTKAWKYPKSPSVAGQLFVLVMNSEGTPPLTDGDFDKLLQQAAQIDAAAGNKTATKLAPVKLTKHPAWLHQLQAYHFAYNLDAAMLAMDMGTGKSKVTVDLLVNRGSKRVLILAPKSVVNVWPKEFRVHAGKPVHVVALSKGTVAKRVKVAEAEMKKATQLRQPVVVVVNYESAWRDDFLEWAKKAKFDTVVCDESHKIKSPSGKASQAAAAIGKTAKWRLALTGTPMPHSPLDVYAQYRFLDAGIYGTSYARFRNHYAIMGGFQNREVKGYQNTDELNRKFYSIAFRVTKDILDLPPAVHITRTFELGKAAMKVYGELEADMYAELPAGVDKDKLIEALLSMTRSAQGEMGISPVIADNALTKILRLQQITSGHIVDDDKRVLEIDTGKRDLLEDILDDLDQHEPVIVFCRFKHDMRQVEHVAEKLGRKYAELSGNRNDLEDAKMPPWADVMAVQIQSGGAGIDLTRARYAVYYSKGYNMGDYEQSLARIHRPGQTRSTTYVHLEAEETIDQKITQVLNKRKADVDQVLGHDSTLVDEAVKDALDMAGFD